MDMAGFEMHSQISWDMQTGNRETKGNHILIQDLPVRTHVCWASKDFPSFAHLLSSFLLYQPTRCWESDSSHRGQAISYSLSHRRSLEQALGLAATDRRWADDGGGKPPLKL